MLSQDIEGISRLTRLRKDYVTKVIDAMQSPNIVQLNQLARVKGIGIKTLEKLFQLAQGSSFIKPDSGIGQLTLF